MILQWEELDEAGNVITKHNPLYTLDSMQNYVDSYIDNEGRRLGGHGFCGNRGYLEISYRDPITDIWLNKTITCNCVDKNLEKIRKVK